MIAKNKSFLIIILIIFISFISAKTFSKLSSKLDGSANKSIAKWDVSLDTSDSSDDLTIVGGNTSQNYNLSVTSLSEVGLNYTIVISDLPSSILVSLDDGEYQSPINNKVTFDNVGSFKASDINKTHNHTLTFSAEVDTMVVSNQEANIDLILKQK